jgi:SNF2 family DNA or RNA helicase
VWSAELAKWSHLKGLRISKIAGTEKQRKEAVRAKADIYTLGRDNVVWFQSVYQSTNVLGKDIMLVIDESSSFKNSASKRFKALKAMQAMFTRVLLLSGTPVPNGLLDLWPQIWLLDRGERLGKTITLFRQRCFEKSYNGFSYDLRDGKDKDIHNAIKDICISMKAEDYRSMPPAIYNDINIELPKPVMDKYLAFEREKVMELINHNEDSQEIAAMNAAALSNKLLQFAGGAVYDEDRGVHEIHTLKLEAAEEVVEAANGKPVLIAYTYKHELDRLMHKLKAYKPVKLEKDSHINDWNAGKIQVLLMHPASGGHGLNLQDGSNIALWYSCNWSLELYQQFNKRLDRQGQQERVIINRLVAQGTEDEAVIRALDRKADTQESLMQSIKAKIEKYSRGR